MISGDGTKTLEIVLKLNDEGRAKLHLPDDVEPEGVQHVIEHVTCDEPSILVLDRENKAAWLPVSRLEEAIITPSGNEARQSRPPNVGMLTYAFWLRPSDPETLIGTRITEALLRYAGTGAPRLVLVTRKVDGKCVLDVICTSEVSSTELGRGCLRPRTKPSKKRASASSAERVQTV